MMHLGLMISAILKLKIYETVTNIHYYIEEWKYL
jgi:hypothetical protein